MEDVFRFADELGPLKLVHIHRSSVGLKAVVAIDNIACGPAIGGVRMALVRTASTLSAEAEQARALENSEGGHQPALLRR
jgi:hypothetical protein